MTGLDTLALVLVLCGSPTSYNPCMHQTLDCMAHTKEEKYFDTIKAVRYCVKNQPINPNRMRKMKWK